ncbi:biopolymer transporter Tol [Cnuibacter physcomitrellae]|uniref:TolB family protein n=1 Tax=Cnuibacter physcomitrellae TaxID=1619308 RepID=UPI0021761735|nr:biopolymer transporter Tol [Cnuibacter physcomitrellae]MCS5498365.1 biopolymer transporter Tol [Cnuibacter physcomitrellae]
MTEDTPTFETGRWPGRDDLQPGQTTQIILGDADGGAAELVFESDRLFEAPNWTPDGRGLVLNSEGGLFVLDLGSRDLRAIDTQGVDHVNNDHIMSPDGSSIYFSAAGSLYSVPLEGGDVRRISNDFPPAMQYFYWLHGVSPDGEMLAYVATHAVGEDPDPRGRIRLATIPAAGGDDVYLTDHEVGHYDGPEYSRDGAWIYYNSEEAATRPGHAQIFRMRPDGSEHQQLTFDDRVNWFPHFDPAGEQILYLSYAPGTQSHPADVELLIRAMDPLGGGVRDVVSLFGGQGSLNVNSWNPEGTRFAYAAYPIAGYGGGIDRWENRS